MCIVVIQYLIIYLAHDVNMNGSNEDDGSYIVGAAADGDDDDIIK